MSSPSRRRLEDAERAALRQLAASGRRLRLARSPSCRYRQRPGRASGGVLVASIGAASRQRYRDRFAEEWDGSAAP